jgi:hypothetical protein
VAIDEEMTGISVSKGRRAAQDLTPAQRYPELKQAPERYSIIQLGIALYHANERNETTKTEVSMNGVAGRGYTNVSTAPRSSELSGFTVRRYNFYMFPAPASGHDQSDEREVVLNPASVSFLHQHNMSFDLWSRQGIPYTTTAKATAALESYVTKEQALLEANSETASLLQPPTIQETIRRRVELRRNEDIDFHARAMAGLREWLDTPIVEAPPAAAAVPPPENAPVALVDGSDDDEVVEDGGPDEEDGAVVVDDTMTGASYLLPPCNSFLRRALYESIAKDYPTLEVEAAENQQIKVWRLNEKEKAARYKRLRKESWESLIGTKLGMWRIFEGLRRACSGLDWKRDSVLFASSYEGIDWTSVATNPEMTQDEEQTRSYIPLIVHNGFMDLCFLLTHFHSNKLADSYQECKDLISDHFPVIYDTKVLATECPCWDANDAIGSHNSHTSSLSNLFQIVVCNPSQPVGGLTLLDEIKVAPCAGLQPNGLAEDQEHEAAFDAYMTGAIFLGLCKRIQQNTAHSVNFLNVISNMDSLAARRLYARNKVYQMSMYTMDLEESRDDRDPMSRGMLPEFTYRVADIDKAVSTRDIVRCLAGTMDTSGRQVNFEIVWIEDTTFLVAASSRHMLTNAGADSINDDDDNDAEMARMLKEHEMLREHGALLLTALRNRFSHKERITVLEDYLAHVATGSGGKKVGQKQKRTWIEWMLSSLGLASESREGSTESYTGKRQRLA